MNECKTVLNYGGAEACGDVVRSLVRTFHFVLEADSCLLVHLHVHLR